MPQPRRVEPERLDALPPADPRAIGSRRDLRRLNVWMRQAAIMGRLLETYGAVAPTRILELGSGDGTFMLGLARRLRHRWPRVAVELVDRQRLVTDETREGFAKLGWNATVLEADVFAALDEPGRPRADIVTANLFLHHFGADELRALLARIAATASFFAACEPSRSPLSLGGSRMVFALGCNAVTRHDAVVSVRAGFRDRELSALWPTRPGWHCDERAAGLFTHTFVARLQGGTPDAA